MNREGKVITFLRTGLNPRTNFVLNPPGAANYYVTVRELDGNGIRFSDKTDRIDDEAVRIINKRSRLRPGDVLFSGTGTIGRTALVTEEPSDWNIKEGVYALSPDQRLISSEYLLRVLQAGPTRMKLLGAAMGSTGGEHFHGRPSESADSSSSCRRAGSHRRSPRHLRLPRERPQHRPSRRTRRPAQAVRVLP